MALIWADFPSGQHGLYGTDKSYMLNGIWTALEGAFASGFTSIVDDPDPNIGSNGYVLKFRQSGPSASWGLIGHRFTLSTATDVAGFGFRMWLDAYPIGDSSRGNPHWAFRTSSNSVVTYLEIGASGQIRAYNSAGTLLGESDPNVITANAFNHLETKVFRDAAAGTIEVRVNGVTRLTLEDLALGANDIVNYFIGQQKESTQANTRTVYYKDMVMWDDVGTYVNDFQGSVAVYDLLTDADVSLNWTPSTGATGWDLIDESPPNDADYIEADATPPAAAQFGLTDLPADVTSVRGLIPVIRSWKTDGGDCDIQTGLSPDGVSWDDGTDRPVTTAATYWWDVSHVSPDTLLPWTPAEVNAANVRVNRTL